MVVFGMGMKDAAIFAFLKVMWILENKIERNKERDLRERIKLRDMGWHVIQFWECQLKPSVRNENLNGLLFTLNHLFLENFAVRHAVLYGEGSRELNLIAAEDETEYEKNKPL